MSIKIAIETSDDIADDNGRLKDDSPLKERVIHAIRGVLDPELPVNVYDLGLIYRLDITDDGLVSIDMTLTAPNCPVADELPRMVVTMVKAVDGVRDCVLKLVWEPKWDKSRLSDEARLELGLF